jgi:hypothetical protein
MFGRRLIVSFMLGMISVVFGQTENYYQWKYSRLIRINTTASGANIPGNLTGFPLSVRLNPGGVTVLNNGNITAENIDVLLFAKSGGEDLRFCRLLANGTLGPPLPYEIEQWSPNGTIQGNVWVLVDTVYGNNATQGIVMLWGKSDAAARSSANQVFAGAQYAGVWHLGNLTGNAAGTYAVRPNAVMGGQFAVPSGGDRDGGFPWRRGLMGLSDTLRGGTDTATFDHLSLGSGYASFANGITMSLWINPAKPLSTGWNVLMGLGNGAPKDNITVGRNGSSRGLFGEVYDNTTGAGRTELSDTLVHNQWQWVTFTVRDGVQTLYYNGEAKTTRTTAVTIPNITRSKAYVGRSLWPDAGFAGGIDEIRIHKTARSADWIRLEYETQKPFSSVPTFVALPGIPDPTQFSVGDRGDSVYAIFGWDSVSNATGYEVQVSLSSDFASAVTTFSPGTISPEVGPLKYSTTYHWRVRGLGTETPGPWSRTVDFSTYAAPPQPTTVPAAPILVNPAQFAVQQPLNVQLSWQVVTGAKRYHAQVSTTPDFSSIFGQDSLLAVPPYRISGLAQARDYYWRVRGKNSLGTGPWSEVFTFRTGISRAPDAPVLASPAAFATGVESPAMLSWNASPSATSYRVEMSFSSEFTSILALDSNVTGLTKATIPLAGQTNYYWRVRAKNAIGSSDWSGVRRFTTGDVVALHPDPASGASSRLSQVRFAEANILQFTLAKTALVRLTVFDANGRGAAVLVNERLEAGSHRIALPALGAGTHWVKFRAGDRHQVLRLQP